MFAAGQLWVGEVADRVVLMPNANEVRAGCLEYALADISLEGVWGGTSMAERRRIRRSAPSADPHAPGRPDRDAGHVRAPIGA